MNFLERLTKQFKRAELRFAVAGGYAVNLHGWSRGTIDIDIVIIHKLDQFERCEQELVGLGLSPKLPVSANEVFQFRDEYIRNRNLISWSFHNTSNPIELVDVLLPFDLSKLTVERIPLFGTTVPILSKQSLIKTKRYTNRPQDIEDIKFLESEE